LSILLFLKILLSSVHEIQTCQGSITRSFYFDTCCCPAKKWRAWLTDPINNIFFQKQSSLSFSQRPEGGSMPFIVVDDKRTYQSIDGFGFALTGGSAMNMMKMSVAARSALIKELFATDKNNIGTSYLRLSIGASDLNETVFSYDDLPAGQTDTGLIHFDLGPDKKDVIPVLKEIEDQSIYQNNGLSLVAPNMDEK
jgi:hypothetical protein